MKPGNFLGKGTYEAFLLLNGIGAPLLIGVAVATFFTGSNFTVVKDSMLSGAAVSSWDSAWHGLEALWNTNQMAWLTNISFGVAIVLLTTILGALNIIKNINDNALVARARAYLLPATVAFLVFFLIFLAKFLTIDGFAYDPATGVVSMEAFKYLNNLLALPIVTVAFLVGVLAVVYGILMGWWKGYRRSFWIAGFGTFLVALSLLLFAGYNNTPFYPSMSDLQSSLTIMNASSSRYTLIAISYATLVVPFVLAYIVYVWSVLRDDGIGKDIVKDRSDTLY